VPSGPRPNTLFRRGSGHADDTPHRRFLVQATLSRGETFGSTRSSAMTRRLYGHKGPFMPLLLYACGEDERASEYEHGSVSYGAFTFVLAKTLRKNHTRPSALALEAVIQQTSSTLNYLGYQQKPEFVGSSKKYPAGTHLGDLVSDGKEKTTVRKSRPKARTRR
jgi:hypothetical protein